MNKHMRSQHTSNDEKKYRCGTCGKGFNNGQSLQDHKMYILEKNLTNANIVLPVLLVKEIKECMKEVMKGIIVISKPILAIKVNIYCEKVTKG